MSSVVYNVVRNYTGTHNNFSAVISKTNIPQLWKGKWFTEMNL